MIKSNSLIAQQPTNPKIVFFGSSKYSPIVAQKLQQEFGIILIVTTPDKPKGRERKLTPNPVSEFAVKNKIAVLATDKLTSETVSKIAAKNPDFLAVADYGLILPGELLALPKYAPLNVHHSMLPKYRGPSPAPSAILAGEKISGVTIIEMTTGVDAGPILTQKEYALDLDETTDSLLTRLNKLGAEILIGAIKDYLDGEEKPLDQEDSQATYTRRFTKEDGRIDLQNPPDSIILGRMIRAFYPWPGVYTKLKMKNEKLKIIKFLPNLPTILPTYHPTDPFIVQPEGKKPMTIREFLNGYPEIKTLIEKLIKQ